MELLKPINLALAFFLEVGALVALGFWGFHVHTSTTFKYVLCLGAPAITAVLWGILAAPNSATRLHKPWLTMFQLAVFVIAAIALYAAGKRQLALVLIVLEVISATLALVWKQ